MSTVIRPVGPRQPKVYWRRRVLALVLVAFVVVAAVLGIRSVFAGGDDAQPAGDAVTAPAADDARADEARVDDDARADDDAQAGAATAPSDDVADVPECSADQVQVVATTDAAAYPAGATAGIGMTITNVGTAGCSMDVGSAALELLVVSGADRIWSSDDCQSAPESRVMTVEPGEGGQLASGVDWPVERSAEGCPDGLEAPRAGTYQLTARAGDLTSEPVAFVVQ